MAARLAKFLLPLMLAAASGCATIPMADPALDKSAKTFAPVPGRSKVYVYRNESFGGAVTMNVLLDDRVLGQTVARSYLVAEVAPGPHKVTSTAENLDTLEFNSDAGGVYYIWQEVKMGFMYARSKLQLVDEKTGQAGVLESQLVAPPK